MPPAAKITVSHACPIPGHAVNPEVSGSGNTLIGFLPAGRMSDTTACGAPIAMGSPTVYINNLMAARLGDPTAHGGVLVSGHPNVIIGVSGQGSALAGASATGAPFCEECEKAKAEATAAANTNAEAAAPPPDSVVFGPEQIANVTRTPDPPEVLAKQKNTSPDDGLNHMRYAAREKLAYDFYDTQVAGMKASAIDSHLRGIDFNHPVEIISIPPDGAGPGGDTVLQRGFPQDDGGLGRNGAYFTFDPSVTPEDVGASSMVSQHGNPRKIVPRDYRKMTVQSGKQIKGLKTTAAPIVDDWSIEGQDVFCRGGGSQVMIPKSVHDDCTTVKI